MGHQATTSNINRQFILDTERTSDDVSVERDGGFKFKHVSIKGQDDTQIDGTSLVITPGTITKKYDVTIEVGGKEKKYRLFIKPNGCVEAMLVRRFINGRKYGIHSSSSLQKDVHKFLFTALASSHFDVDFTAKTLMTDMSHAADALTRLPEMRAKAVFNKMCELDPSITRDAEAERRIRKDLRPKTGSINRNQVQPSNEEAFSPDHQQAHDHRHIFMAKRILAKLATQHPERARVLLDCPNIVRHKAEVLRSGVWQHTGIHGVSLGHTAIFHGMDADTAAEILQGYTEEEIVTALHLNEPESLSALRNIGDLTEAHTQQVMAKRRLRSDEQINLTCSVQNKGQMYAKTATILAELGGVNPECLLKVVSSQHLDPRVGCTIMRNLSEEVATSTVGTIKHDQQSENMTRVMYLLEHGKVDPHGKQTYPVDTDRHTLLCQNFKTPTVSNRPEPQITVPVTIESSSRELLGSINIPHGETQPPVVSFSIETHVSSLPVGAGAEVETTPKNTEAGAATTQDYEKERSPDILHSASIDIDTVQGSPKETGLEITISLNKSQEGGSLSSSPALSQGGEQRTGYLTSPVMIPVTSDDSSLQPTLVDREVASPSSSQSTEIGDEVKSVKVEAANEGFEASYQTMVSVAEDERELETSISSAKISLQHLQAFHQLIVKGEISRDVLFNQYSEETIVIGLIAASEEHKDKTIRFLNILKECDEYDVRNVINALLKSNDDRAEIVIIEYLKLLAPHECRALPFLYKTDFLLEAKDYQTISEAQALQLVEKLEAIINSVLGAPKVSTSSETYQVTEASGDDVKQFHGDMSSADESSADENERQLTTAMPSHVKVKKTVSIEESLAKSLHTWVDKPSISEPEFSRMETSIVESEPTVSLAAPVKMDATLVDDHVVSPLGAGDRDIPEHIQRLYKAAIKAEEQQQFEKAQGKFVLAVHDFVKEQGSLSPAQQHKLQLAFADLIAKDDLRHLYDNLQHREGIKRKGHKATVGSDLYSIYDARRQQNGEHLWSIAPKVEDAVRRLIGAADSVVQESKATGTSKRKSKVDGKKPELSKAAIQATNGDGAVVGANFAKKSGASGIEMESFLCKAMNIKLQRLSGPMTEWRDAGKERTDCQSELALDGISETRRSVLDTRVTGRTNAMKRYKQNVLDIREKMSRDGLIGFDDFVLLKQRRLEQMACRQALEFASKNKGVRGMNNPREVAIQYGNARYKRAFKAADEYEVHVAKLAKEDWKKEDTRTRQVQAPKKKEVSDQKQEKLRSTAHERDNDIMLVGCEVLLRIQTNPEFLNQTWLKEASPEQRAEIRQHILTHYHSFLSIQERNQLNELMMKTVLCDSNSDTCTIDELGEAIGLIRNPLAFPMLGMIAKEAPELLVALVKSERDNLGLLSAQQKAAVRDVLLLNPQVTISDLNRGVIKETALSTLKVGKQDSCSLQELNTALQFAVVPFERVFVLELVESSPESFLRLVHSMKRERLTPEDYYSCYLGCAKFLKQRAPGSLVKGLFDIEMTAGAHVGKKFSEIFVIPDIDPETMTSRIARREFTRAFNAATRRDGTNIGTLDAPIKDIEPHYEPFDFDDQDYQLIFSALFVHNFFVAKESIDTDLPIQLSEQCALDPENSALIEEYDQVSTALMEKLPENKKIKEIYTAFCQEMLRHKVERLEKGRCWGRTLFTEDGTEQSNLVINTDTVQARPNWKLMNQWLQMPVPVAVAV